MTNALFDPTTGISSVEFGAIKFPADWLTTQLGDVLEIVRGVTYKGQEAVYADTPGYLPILRATNVGPTLDFEAMVYVPAQRVSENQRLRSGDIVVAASSGSRAVVGKAALLKAKFDGSFGAFCFALRPNPEVVDPRFLAWYLQTSDYRNRVSALSAGVNINNLRKNHIESLPFAIPPLDEQRQIVAAIETQFARLDDAVASLNRARVRLKRYRASVLKAACEGRLVPTEAELAREEGRDYEPASVLLERIKAEREAAPAKGRGKGNRGGPTHRRPGSGQGQLLLMVDGGTAPTEAAELPDGWAWTSVEDVADVGTGATPLRSKKDFYEGGEIPWVTSGALNRETIQSASEFVTELALQKTNLKLFPTGTLLVAMYGEGKTRGKVSELLLPATTNQAIAALVFQKATVVLKPMVKLFLHSQYEDMRREASGGVQPNLNLGIVKGIRIPCPPLAEQERIVMEVERITSVIDQMEATVEANLRRTEALRQSILRRAFSGRLVSAR